MTSGTYPWSFERVCITYTIDEVCNLPGKCKYSDTRYPFDCSLLFERTETNDSVIVLICNRRWSIRMLIRTSVIGEDFLKNSKEIFEIFLKIYCLKNVLRAQY